MTVSTDDPELLALQAGELLDRRRIPTARSLLARALAAHPGHPSLLFEAARSEVMDDRHDAARALLESLLNADPGNEGARLLMFSVEIEAGNLAAAELLILGLLRESPDEALFYAYYARLMLRALDFVKAGRLADEALRREPNSDICLQTKALCDIAEGRVGHDSEAMIQLLVRHPDDVQTLKLVVAALAQARRFDEALRLAQDLLRAQPDDPKQLDLVLELREVNHWSLWPLWPTRRWGWAGAAALWGLMLIAFQLLARLAPELSGPAMVAWLVLVIYSWVWPPLLHRWLRRNL